VPVFPPKINLPLTQWMAAYYAAAPLAVADLLSLTRL